MDNSATTSSQPCIPNLIDDPNYGVISKQSNYDAKLQRAKSQARPIGEGHNLVIICCFDPRTNPAAEQVVKHINYNGLYLQVRVAGGRAIDALRSLATAHYMFSLEAIAVVHHTFCGLTSFTSPVITQALAEEEGIHLNDKMLGCEGMKALSIDNLSKSVKDDVKLIEERIAGRNIKVWGFVYDIMTDKLIEIK